VELYLCFSYMPAWPAREQRHFIRIVYTVSTVQRTRMGAIYTNAQHIAVGQQAYTISRDIAVCRHVE
jgi:hypothetical protein